MNNKLKSELKKSFNPPPVDTNMKKEFLNNLNFEKPRECDIYFLQIRYIRKRFWMISALIVILAFHVLSVYEDSYSKTVALSSILPLLALLSIGEISKSISFNMYELEMSCKYNLQWITLIQMGIIGTVNFIIMLVLLVVCSYSTKIGLGLTTLYCVTPYLLVNYLTLIIMNNLKTRENLYICYAVVFFVSFFVYNLTKTAWLFNGNIVYKLSFGVVVLIILLVREFMILIKEREDVQCHSKLTV